jgi:hypothetical protein
MPEGPEKNKSESESEVKREDVKERIVYVEKIVEVEKKGSEEITGVNPAKEWIKKTGNKFIDLVIERKTIAYMREEYTKSSQFFMKLVIKWKWHFLAVTGFALLASFVFSCEWFVKPKYRSTAIIYPSNIIPYSSESASEQMLQLFESADIRDHVIAKFNLAEHYGVDTTEKAGVSKLISVYESNVEVRRTEYESIEIRVLDTDSELAAKIVNEIIDALNLKARMLQREKTKEVVVINANQMVFKKKQVDSLNAVLEELRVKYQILDYESQSKEVLKSYLKAVSAGKSKESLKDIDELMRNLEEKGGEYLETKKTFDAILKSYNATKLDYDNALKDLKKELTYTNVVTKPRPSDKKAYPIRWLIMLVSTVAADFFLFVVLVVMESRKSETKQ